MNLRELEGMFFNASSTLMRMRGEKIFRKGLVSKIKAKEIGNIYHIYADVDDGVQYEKFKTHIRVNTLTKKLEGVSCTCDEFKEFSSSKRLFMCEHLTATTYKLLDMLINEKRSESTKIYKKIRRKMLVDFGTKIICKSFKSKIYYEAEFWIGNEKKHLITDLRSFIRNFYNEDNILINNNFVYDFSRNSVSLNDKKMLDYLRRYIKNSKKSDVIGRSITILPEELHEFLQCILNKKIIFKYNGIEYKTDVLQKDLPLSFTLKEREKLFILTTHKNLPTPLNRGKDIYFWNSYIYLPSKNQIKKYGMLYDKFKSQKEITYKKTMESYNEIVSLINTISKDITITSKVKEFGSKVSKLFFNVYKEKSNVYCKVLKRYLGKETNILDSNDKLQFFEDLHEREKIFMKLENCGFVKDEDKFIFKGTESDLDDILLGKNENIKALGEVILGQGLDHTEIYNSKFIDVNIKEKGNEFEFSYGAKGIFEKEWNNIFKSYKSGDKFYRTYENKFIDFEDEGIKQFLDLVDILNCDEKFYKNSIKIDKNKILYIDEKLKKTKLKSFTGVEVIDNIKNQLDFIKNKKIKVPKNLNAKLRNYQITGFKWFDNLNDLGFGGILADEMGLGKTIQSITFMLSNKEKNFLVVVPTSVIYNWKEEIEKFAPTLKLGIMYGSKNEKSSVIKNIDKYDVVLTTYGTLKNNIEQCVSLKFYSLIIDEAQNIKNPTSQNTIAVKKIKAETKFALTGTPIENNLTELWSIFDFIMPGYLYSNKKFEEKFIYSSDCDLESLKILIKPFILRRTKEEVVKDLPEKIEEKILVEISKEEKIIYNSYIKDIKEKIKDKSKGNIQVFSYLTKLRQICLDPSLVTDNYEGHSSKLEKAISLIENGIKNNKILVFSQFTSALSKIKKSLKQIGIDYFYLDGGTPSKQRLKLVDKFNHEDKVKVFLISLKAGGTGLNLTSANLVIHFDPWWNPAVEAQASDRAHRIGQKNVVEVMKLIAKGTIEEKIVDLQEKKKELVHSVITGELKNNNVVNKLSMEDLYKIFQRD